MLEKIKSFIGEHPYASAGVVFVVGIVVIFAFSGSSSSAASTTASDQPSDAAVQANASVEQAQIGAATQLQLASAAGASQENQLNAQLAALQTQSGTQVQLAQISLQGLQAQLNEALGVNNNQTNIEGAQINAQYTALIDAQHDAANVAEYNTGASTQIESQLINKLQP